MPAPLTPVDTRAMFRPVSLALVELLRGLPDSAWGRPTVAGAWVVRDVVAHLIDTTLRRLSFHRDGMEPPPPDPPVQSERDLVAFLNGLNRQWVIAARRLSPRVLTDLCARASAESADWHESLPLDGPALFPVSWAGEAASAGWFDIGREFTEIWHHQQQIRMAVDAPPLDDPRYLRAVVDVAVRGLPHAYRDVRADPGVTVALDVRGPSGGRWTLTRAVDRWEILGGTPSEPTACLTVEDEAAWQILFNALPEVDAARLVAVEGPAGLATPFLRARSVVV